MKQYSPQSYFFTDHTNLTDASVIDAFGPVDGDLTTKYRVTSFVNGTANLKIKLFAISGGSLMIFPQKDNVGNLTGKLNIVIKPSQMNWSPLKIKYFVYRGVEKDDFFDSNWILKEPVADSPQILTKMWAYFKSLNLLPSITGVIFPVEYIFQLNTPSDKLLDEHFTNSLINCTAGEHIGYFKGRIGLDIVLDYGDYQLENQENLFNLNVEYASKNEFVFDTSTIPGSTQTKVQRYKEYIHQFIDAAAFWGSHIDCGKIDIKNGTPLKTVSQINSIIQKYFTKDKIYIYIQENNKSFNYYDQINQTRKVYGFDSNGEAYKKDDWPILIKNISASVTNKIDFAFDYLIENVDIQQPERNISIDTIAPNLNLDGYPFTERANNTALSGKTNQVQITFAKVANNSPCANFAFFNVRVLQKFPVENYFNHLWIANLKSSLTIDLNEYDMYSCTYDKSRNISLDDTIGESAIIQNKVYFDKGKNTAGNVKRRRLYTAVIKNNSNKEVEYESLNIDTPHSIFVKKNANKQDYFLNLFKREKNFSIYRGIFEDTTLGTGLVSTVNSLCIFHENSLLRRNTYLFLGITDDEYNLFVIPVGADNIFFDLHEDFAFTSENVRKFKLGLKYEDASGSINSTTYYPSSDIFVYSIDDLFFFSKEFSDYQNYFNEFANAKVEFRPLMNQSAKFHFDHDNNPSTPPILKDIYNFNPVTSIPSSINFYNGEFGFDWLRIGDNGEPAYGDNGVIDEGYERRSTNDNDTKHTEYKDYHEAYKFLKRKYYSLPTQKLDIQYYAPYLSLFGQQYNNRSSNIPKPPFEATLRVLVEIDQGVGKMEFDFDPVFFALDKNILTDKNPTYVSGTSGNIEKKESIDKTIKITCLKSFAESKLIKIWAYSSGLTEKKLAGLIYVAKNDNVQKQKIVLIKCKTKIDTIEETGFYMSDEIINLKNTIYQNSLDFTVVEGVVIDLTTDVNFKQSKVGGSPITKNFVHKDGGILTYKDNTSTGQQLHDYLKTKFFTITANQIYLDYFLVFAFDVKNTYEELVGGTIQFNNYTLGEVEAIAKKNVVLYKPLGNTTSIPRDLTTLNHEFMHGLGLYHTHRETDSAGNLVTISENEKKYTFAHAFNPIPPNPLNATDNVMSYNSNAITLWWWQRKILKL